MATSEHAVDGHVLVEDGEELGSTGGVAPIAHELADNGEVGDNLDTGGAHAVVGLVTDQLGGGARSLVVGPDLEASLAQRQSKESRA